MIILFFSPRAGYSWRKRSFDKHWCSTHRTASADIFKSRFWLLRESSFNVYVMAYNNNNNNNNNNNYGV